MIASQPAAGPEPFGKYLLDREIARGGMARVHLARLRGLGGFEKRLVVKQILPQLASDPRFVEMFVEEAKTLVQMSHPHIVPVYELGVVDGVYFLAMEYVEGATLADVLEDGPLDPAEAAHAGAQICDALSYAHERFSIVHRDVTPRNVMVDALGHCRLLDFGIAAPATDDAGGLFGTPGYLSPEQARGEAVAPSSDVFSLGAALFHALRGEPPAEARTIDRARALRPGDPGPALGGELDRELAIIVERALDPDPAARFPDARSMGRALRSWLAARHPEGVAHELGARADRARARRERSRTDVEEVAGTARIARTPVATRGGSPARVETLAQSRALEELARSAEPAAAAGVTGDAAPEVDGGTLAIPGRGAKSAPSARPAPLPGWAAPALGMLALGGLVAIAIATTVGSSPESSLRETSGGEQADEIVAAAPPRTAASETPAAEARAPEPAVVEALPGPAAERPDIGGSPAAEAPSLGPARRASIAITAARGWATIEIDGRAIGVTPVRRAQLAPGTHTVVARNDVLGREARARIDVAAGARLHAVVDLDRATIDVRER